MVFVDHNDLELLDLLLHYAIKQRFSECWLDIRVHLVSCRSIDYEPKQSLRRYLVRLDSSSTSSYEHSNLRSWRRRWAE